MKQSFYGRIRAQGYDLGTDPSEIVNYYIKHLERVGKPGPLLEPMCGTGLNLIPFLILGAPCDGIDSSPFMLEICQMKIQQLGLTSNLSQQNLETLELVERYGFIFIPGGSFGHIYDKQIAAACLQRLYDHLRPGGWLVFDVRPPETEVFDYRERSYDASEIESDLRRAGFQTVHITKAYGHDVLPGERDGLVCSCQK